MIGGCGEVKCAVCPNMTRVRSREEIAAGLRNTVAMCLRMPNGIKSLAAHLWWLEGELLGLCTDCTLERASQLHHDAEAELRQPPVHPPAPNVSSPFLQPRLRVVHDD